MVRCCTGGNLEVTQRDQDQQEQVPPQGQEPQLPGRASKPQDLQGPTQLSPEGLSHGPPLSLIALTLLVNSLHNQVHDVKQDPGNKSQLIMVQNGEARECPGFSTVQLTGGKHVHKG